VFAIANAGTAIEGLIDGDRGAELGRNETAERMSSTAAVA
jgi:hypothetical protein